MKGQELGVCLENSIPSFRAGGEVAGPFAGVWVLDGMIFPWTG